MLRSVKELRGYKLAAEDGAIGKVKDFLFDEAQWAVRWMVADTGVWLPKRLVLISPVSLGDPDWGSHLLPVRLTRDAIERAPGLSKDEPVSREYERRFFDTYGWPYYWSGVGVWGGAAAPGTLFARQEKADVFQPSPESGAHVLRSAQEVMGYYIHARDGDVGHVADFVVDDEIWAIRYLVVDTKNWLPGRKVLVAPAWIDDIIWADRKVVVDLTKEAVKDSPLYEPSTPVNREYESRLYDYYGRPVYWADEKH